MGPPGGDLSAPPLRDAWLGVDPLPPKPVEIVDGWLREAFESRTQQNPHAVALATVDPDGSPSVRMVLCSAIDTERGSFTMYTNRESRKGRALSHDPRAAIAFHWPDRQVRVEGRVEWTPDETCDAYFSTRPLEARLGAWASRQSEELRSRAELLTRVAEVAERFAAHREEDVVPRPQSWGGLTLVATSVELWVSRPGRIHDRAVWRRNEVHSAWNATRLQP